MSDKAKREAAARDAIAAIAEAIEAFPEMRLAQILVNAVGPDPFYIADEALAVSLRKYIAERMPA